MTGRRSESTPGRLRLSLAIAARWWTGRPGGRGQSRLVSGTARAAFFSGALGTLAMTVAMALLTGYREELVDRLVGANAALVVYPLTGEGAGYLPRSQFERLAALPGVLSVERVAFGQGTLASDVRPDGVAVTMRGGEPGSPILGAGTPVLPRSESAAGDPSPDLPPIILGSGLAEDLRVAVGDTVRWTALGFSDGRPRFSYQTLRVAATFHVGFSEFDRSWAATTRDVVIRRVGGIAERSGGGSGRDAHSSELEPLEPEAAASMIELRLADPLAAAELSEQVRAVVGEAYLVSDWQALNSRLFGALRCKQRMLFLVLGLIVVVSTFHVASTLVVAARERMREIGLLRALGMGPADVRRTFLIHGLALGWAGAIAGAALGAIIALVLDRAELIRFDAGVAAIYFLDAVPFHVRALDLAAIVGFASLVHLVACWIPTRRAARVSPAVALRDE